MVSRSTLLKFCSMCCNTGDSRKRSQWKRSQSHLEPSEESDPSKQLDTSGNNHPSQLHPAQSHLETSEESDPSKQLDPSGNNQPSQLHPAKQHLSRTSHALEQLIQIRQLSGAETLVDIHGYTVVKEVRVVAAARLGLPRNRTQIIDPRNQVAVLKDSEKLATLDLHGVPYLQIIVGACHEVTNSALRTPEAQISVKNAQKRLEKELSGPKVILTVADGNAVYTFLDIPGFSVTIKDNDFFTWSAKIMGPVDTPYEGGIFYCNLFFPHDYPFQPPEMFFNTKIYHCNIGATGIVCMDILHDQWSPAMTGPKLLVAVGSLLGDPNPHDPIMIEASELYLSDKTSYDALARESILALLEAS